MTASAERPPSKLLYGLRLTGLCGWFLVAVIPHLATRILLGRSAWPQRFLKGAGWIVGLRPRVTGTALGPHSLILANHTSWLDILLLGGWAGAAFVSKAEVKSTPLLGWLADQSHTLYIERAARRDSHGQVKRIREALEKPRPLAVFPEGTTGGGRHLLPFRSTLLEAVAPPPPEAVVRPTALDYGEYADLVGWHSGEPGLANFRRVLGHRGVMPVTIRLLDALPPDQDRKALARHARHAIAAALSSLHAQDTL